MTSSLNITKSLTPDNKWEIVAFVVPGGALPEDIFIYENEGTSQLGRYVGACNLEEYQRLKTFTGDPIAKFGNRYVKSTQAKIILDILDDPANVIIHLTNTVKALSLALANASSTTQIVNIP